jgi:hypothetical protein
MRRVAEGSTEALIVRHYRQATRTGFLKALSEDPAALVSGFGKLDKTLRALSLSRVHLWPRYAPVSLIACDGVHRDRRVAVDARALALMAIASPAASSVITEMEEGGSPHALCHRCVTRAVTYDSRARHPHTFSLSLCVCLYAYLC